MAACTELLFVYYFGIPNESRADDRFVSAMRGVACTVVEGPVDAVIVTVFSLYLGNQVVGEFVRWGPQRALSRGASREDTSPFQRGFTWQVKVCLCSRAWKPAVCVCHARVGGG